jgi:hypothetical protein
VKKRSALLLLGLCLLLSALLRSRSTPRVQQCGEELSIWTNTESQKMTVTMRLTDNCHEPEDQGIVKVYDQANVLVGTPFTFSRGYTVTVSLDIPVDGHIGYICKPSHVLGEKKCVSEIVSVVPAQDSGSKQK